MTKASYYETTNVFDYTWKQVIQAFWNRYPNPASTHVLTEDTIFREVRDGKLYTRRLLSKTNPLPRWGERFYSAKSVKIIEDSILDLENRILITYTRNVGFKKVMKVDERVEYKESDDGKTIAVRSAWVSSQVFGFSRAIRVFGVERFKANCNKTVQGFNYVLLKMFPNHRHHFSSLPLENSKKAIEQHSQSGSTQQQVSKMTKLKSAGKSTFNFIKNQAYKVYQFISVKS